MADTTPSSSAVRVVNSETLHTVYELLRGSPLAIAVLNAEDAFRDGDFATAFRLIEDVYRQYVSRYGGILERDLERSAIREKPSPRQLAKLQTRQEKIRAVLESFEAILPVLKRMAAGKEMAPVPVEPAPVEAPPADDHPPAVPSPSSIPDLRDAGLATLRQPDFRKTFAEQSSVDSQRQVLARFFDVKPVESTEDLAKNTLYFLEAKIGTGYLVRTSAAAPIAEQIALRHAMTGKPIQPIAAKALVQLGRMGRFERLSIAAPDREHGPVDREETGRDTTALAKGAEDPSDDASAYQQTSVLTMGDFSQLLDAVKRTGLVPNADIIAQVRDREFRKRDYQKALQEIESLSAKLTASATAREQRLNQEERAIKSGKTRLSPKELQQKRARDQAESLLIDRARKRFRRVLEGLRLLCGDS